MPCAARPRLWRPSHSVLLLDEPLSNLDPYWVLRTLQILRDEMKNGERAVVVSLHDLESDWLRSIGYCSSMRGRLSLTARRKR